MTRTQIRLTGIAVAAGLLLTAVVGLKLLSASLASAQGVPPETPLVLYGTAAGQTTGAGVVAVVLDGASATNCGSGLIKSEGGQKYVVQVAHDSQKAGCGDTGRTIRIYVFPASSFNGNGGTLANQIINWSPGQVSENNLTFGAQLTVRGFVTLATSDGN